MPTLPRPARGEQPTATKRRHVPPPDVMHALAAAVRREQNALAVYQPESASAVARLKQPKTASSTYLIRRLPYVNLQNFMILRFDKQSKYIKRRLV